MFHPNLLSKVPASLLVSGRLLRAAAGRRSLVASKPNFLFPGVFGQDRKFSSEKMDKFALADKYYGLERNIW